MAFLKHNGRTICYRLLGDAEKPLLVLAHPLGMTQGVWDDMLPMLLPRFRVLTWDLPGHGASSAWNPISDAIQPEDLAGEALALAEQAGARAFHFAGTSIGGVIGQQLVSQHAERLISATLTNTGAVIGTPEAWQQRSANVLEQGLAAMAMDIVPRWFGPAACEQQPALLDGWRVIMGRGDDRSYALLCEMLGRCNFREALAGRDVPVLLIGGSDDVATPPAALQELAGAIGTADPVILENIGHVPSVECPVQFADLLIRHLS
ncbi:alpha/beta fold hydrolase [Marinobacter profundi]|uniref:3-oxoadipate enol-lactone hydrolase n=1 Tax=Marinobacter profundi TaxID=2666256 RepID=A0A2G1ULQ5_9GAMM|nr:alpha/beta fold hydrolase [Marinobacter profundi]PHQ15434.1 3-oxoadipate enol-lactone hydrolase [Marinobacter profundi]